MDADADFTHLRELLGRLPAMRRQGKRLARAREAKRVVRLEAERASRSALLAAAEERLAATERGLAHASECGPAVGDGRGGDAVGKARRAVLQAAALRGYCVGPCRNAERALSCALEKGPFASVDDARSALMDDAALSELEEEVAAYRQDYAQTLESCERFAALQSTDR
ncbi:hypothetical protein B5F40_09940 [Gordonibacter sp. An230]|uniref:hypothetical protein n=1 Tax=Gordonibacter sp. An230 TaxID=1965592 RepID=UPI000B3AAA47|nr:hypothetical protein [Gordonibacter sp. An230]OUO89702.1 hypothetical protein B5F40_09940 [Gordonibacter sp. An230]